MNGRERVIYLAGVSFCFVFHNELFATWTYFLCKVTREVLADAIFQKDFPLFEELILSQQ